MAVDAGSIYSAVRIQLDKLKGDVKSVETLLDQIGQSSEKNAKDTQDAFESAFDATKLAGVAAFAAITLAMKQSIKVAGDYEQSIANVQSVVMGSADTFDMLNAKAKKAGEQTRFTASEAADALYDLAQGGLSATEAVDALDGVLMLAGATQAGLSDAASLTVATLNQFNLAASEAARISNVFAAASSQSMANIGKLTAGMRQAGPVASAMGLSLEETVAALEALFDAGFQGEQAGTAIRAILSSIASEADPTTRKLLEMGLSFDKINPAANSFADIIDNISKAGLTAGDVMNAFGTRAGAQMLTFLRVGRDGLKEYEKGITDTNTAAEMYEIQNDTLAGSLDRLKSAAESAQIEFVEQFTPAMRAVLEVLTKITIIVAGLPGPLKIFFGILLAGVPVVLGLTKAVSALSLALHSVSGPIGWVVAGVAAAAAGFDALSTAINNAEIKATEAEFGDLARSMNMTAKELKELTREAEDFGLSVEDYQRLINGQDFSDSQLYYLREMMREVREEMGQVIPLNEEWAGIIGVSFEQMVRILAASKDVTEADRERLASIIEGIDAEKAYLDKMNERAKTEQELLLEEKRAKVKATNERIKTLKVEGDAQQALFDVYEDTLSEIDNRVRLGVITEKEALEEKKKASDALIKALLAQETQYLNNDEAIREAVATGKEFTAGVKEIEDAEKAAKDAEDARLKAIEEVNDEQKRMAEQLEELGATEIELAEIQRARKIATIEASKADDDAKEAAIETVNAYYDGYVAMLQAQAQLAKDDALKNAMEAQAKTLAEVGKKGEDLLEVRRRLAIEEAEASGASEDIIKARIEQINEYYDALVDEERNKAFIKAEEEREKALKKEADEAERIRKKQEEDIASYQAKLEDLGATELEVIENQRRRAIEGAEGNEELIASINAYYDELYKTTAEDAAIAKTKAMANEIKRIWDGLSGSLASLFSAIYDDKLDALERELQAELEAAGLADETARERAEKALADAKAKNEEEIALIEKRLQAAKEAGDDESAMLLQQQIDKANADAAEVEAEKQKAIDKAIIEEDYAERKKAIQFEAAMVGWRIQMAQAVADAAMLALNGFLTKPFIPAGLAAGALATAQGGLQIAAVSMAKPKLATGGIVLPRMGGTDVTLAENQYPELALNAGPSGQELMAMFARQIVDHMQGMQGGGTTVIQLQVDRKTLSTIVVDDINNGRVRLNR